MPYKVTQYNSRGTVVHTKTYWSKVWAIIVAWVVSGPGYGDDYRSTVDKVEEA